MHTVVTRKGARLGRHKYDGVKVEMGGRGLIGNKYCGKDFWDD
jgi:hypothetical protein